MAILAKSDGESLSCHTRACLRAAEGILDSLALPEELRAEFKRDVLPAVAFHDVGKGAKGFQDVLLRKQKRWGKRHEIISAAVASRDKAVSEFSLFAVLTHHKTIPAGIGALTSNPQYGALPDEQIPGLDAKPVWNRMLSEWEANLAEILKEMEPIRAEFKTRYGQELNFDAIDTRINFDERWLERDFKGQRKIPFERRLRASLVRGIVISADHLGSAHQVPEPPLRLSDYQIIRTPRNFQRRLGEQEGSAILRAPTGSGKTEAALMWAQRNQRKNGRLYYVLPYTASANAMKKRLGSIFGREKIGLLHHRAVSSLYHFLEAEEEELTRLGRQESAKQLATLAKEIWHPIRICTPHQLLKVALRGKGWEMMLNEFRDACFIFDEVHAYEPRIVGLTLGSIKLLQDIGFSPRVLFLSATMPTFLMDLIRESFPDTPLFEPDVNEESDRGIIERKRHHIEMLDRTLTESIERIIEEAKTGKSVLVVCNHVKSAQNVFLKLRESIPADKLILLHGKFNAEDRDAIERTVTEGGCAGRILVSTQVVEVSLNIDFDIGFFEPAPIDAIVQRMGRVNRQGEKDGRIFILSKQLGTFNLYCKCAGHNHSTDCVIKKTLEVLSRISNRIAEEDLVRATEEVYSEGYAKEAGLSEFKQGLNHPGVAEFQNALLAGVHEEWSEKIINEADKSIQVLPESLLDEYRKRYGEGLWIEANSLLVPVRVSSLSWLHPVYDRRLGELVVGLPYTKTMGLMTKDKMKPLTIEDCII